MAPDGKMMAATVKAATGLKPTFEHEPPVILFDTRMAFATDTRAFQYDVSSDGKRFLVVTNASPTPSGAAPGLPPITVVANWSKQ